MPRRLIGILLLGIVLFGSSTVSARNYPTGPVKIVVPFPAGGSADVVARLVAHLLTPRLGQPVIIESRPGANGDIAAEAVARAAPDGLTLLQGYDPIFAVNPFVYPKRVFDPMVDLVPVASVVATPMVLFVNPVRIPAKDFSGFVEFAKNCQPPLLYASIGPGSPHHLGMELLKKAAGFQAVHIPFRGGAPASNALLSGEVAAMLGGAGASGSLVQAGKLRALANASALPSPLFPDLPTIGQFYPGYDVWGWHGIFAPSKTPKEIVDRLRVEVNAVIAEPEFINRMLNSSSGIAYSTTPEQFAAKIKADRERLAPTIRELGLQIN